MIVVLIVCLGVIAIAGWVAGVYALVCARKLSGEVIRLAGAVTRLAGVIERMQGHRNGHSPAADILADIDAGRWS